MRHSIPALLMTGLLGIEPLWAQVPDPTRPSGTDVGPDVQTIILRPDGRSGAVVFGEYVELGSFIGNRRVVKITEAEVTLQSDKGTEVLKTMPTIEKVSKSRRSAVKRIETNSSESHGEKGHANP